MRDKLDRYYTPDALATAMIGALPIQGHESVIEPSVGGGAIARALIAHGTTDLSGCDLDPDAPGLPLLGSRGLVADWADPNLEVDRADWVIGNPPWSHAEQHLHLALERSRVGVAFLLRASFLGSQKRIDGVWGGKTPLERMIILRERPSYTADGSTDNVDSAIFVWLHGHTGSPSIEWLSWR